LRGISTRTELSKLFQIFSDTIYNSYTLYVLSMTLSCAMLCLYFIPCLIMYRSAKPRFPTLGVSRWITEVWCASQSRWITQHGECLLADFFFSTPRVTRSGSSVGSPGERSSRPRLALTPMALSSSSPQQRHITWMVWKPRMRNKRT
jgi:hypothetical protein